MTKLKILLKIFDVTTGLVLTEQEYPNDIPLPRIMDKIYYRGNWCQVNNVVHFVHHNALGVEIFNCEIQIIAYEFKY